MTDIIVAGAREGNLKNISLPIPKNKLVVLTGLSGSGKTTLALEVIYQECQRQYLEAIGYQGIHKPNVDYIKNLSPAVRITQNEANKNPRSTVGTVTNIYTELRMIYEKLGVRTCPNCKETISSADCREETEKKDGEFFVYMYCNHCNFKMDKLTRSYFSHNTREGACKTCQGLGKVMTISHQKVIREDLSLEDGAVAYWGQGYKEYEISALYNAFRHYQILFQENTPVSLFGDAQKALLYYGVESSQVKELFPDIQPPKTVVGGRFEGVFTALWRRLSDKGGESKEADEYFEDEICPECNGERLGELSRFVTVEGIRLPALTQLSLEELYEWLIRLDGTLSKEHRQMVESFLLDLKTKIQRIINVGLGYLSLDRQTITLSGGEMQRIKLAATLDSDLTGIIYIMDEPTIGLHSKDTEGMITILKKLRDLGNTVLIIEHDTDVMKAADYIIDIGPGSGKHGGQVIGAGTLEDLKENPSSITGKYLKKPEQEKENFRKGTGQYIKVKQATRHNLKQVDVSFPLGRLVAVTGVSGSGKSTLVFDVLGKGNNVEGLEAVNQIVTIEQSAITRMKRSNVATYSDVYSEIRKIFGGLEASKKKGLTAKHFSFNTKGGRCENCEGLGYITSNMLFFENIDVICPVCGGNQFNQEVLSVTYQDLNIKEILKLSVEEALTVFEQESKIQRTLKLLEEVGLNYLELGQTLTTLSGGEGQRLKLAKELIGNKSRNILYLMDEPTTGLHPLDVEHFLSLLNRMVEQGNTVIVVEHNQQVILAADWVIDLGPEGGRNGGEIVFEGTPAELKENGKSVTAECLRR